MSKQFSYKPSLLVEMAHDYLEAERCNRDFIRRHTNQYGRLVLESADDRIEYWKNDKESSCNLDAICKACRMVGADVDIVLATAKAMNRYERRMRYQVCAHLPTGWCSGCGDYGEDRVRRFFDDCDGDANYFKSTGRRHPWSIQR